MKFNMAYDSRIIRDLILATLGLNGGGKRITYLSITLIRSFFPSIPPLKDYELEKALTLLHREHILSYHKVLGNRKMCTACFYKIRIDNSIYVYHRPGSRYSNVLRYFSVPMPKTNRHIPTLRLVVNFPPNAVNAKLSVLIGVGLDNLINYTIPIRTTREKSEVWKYLSLHQKVEVPLASIEGRKYYKSGGEYVSKMIGGGKRRNGVKSGRIAQAFVQGFNMHNKQYVIANFSPTTQELLDNRQLALKNKQDIQALAEDIARFCK